MTIIDLIFGMVCVILGFALCQLYYEVIKKDDSAEKIDELKESDPAANYSSKHFFDYDLSKQDFVITGDRHADTIEKSFSKNEVKHAKEYWKYTFKDGESVKSDHPLSNEELKPLVDIHEEIKPDGLEVIKL